MPFRITCRRTSLVAFVIAIAVGIFGVSHACAEKPNVLLIVSDDQGYNDLGLLGNGIITPNLDRLASEGTRLTNFYVAWPACTPSRGAILTGRYPQRNGIYDMIRNEAPDYGKKYSHEEYQVSFERIGGMDEREILLPSILKSSGYRSGIFGKWDLGTLKRYLPTSRGFDEFYGFVNTGIDYYTHERYGVPSMYSGLLPTTRDKGTYCTDLFRRKALRFIDDLPDDQPFFLYLPFNAPHNSSALESEIRSTVQAPQKYKNMYPAVKEEYREVDSWRYASPAKLVTKQAGERDYRAAVTCMDDAIGAVIDRLESRRMLDNTIVIFFSDNGGGSRADNSPLRGKKGDTWEGGVRVPFIVRWPAGRIPANVVNASFLTSMELVPSLAAVTGARIPQGLKLDGYDWWSTLRGDSPSPRKEMIWKRKDQIAVRVGNWKWVKMGEKSGGLFDLESDPSEKHDVSREQPKVLEMMQNRYRDWLAEMDAAEPRGPFRDY